MIEFVEAIMPDQITTSINSNKVRIFYPRGQTNTVLAFLCDQNPQLLSLAAANTDNGFTQWNKMSNGDYSNTCEPKTNAACIIKGMTR